MNHIVVLIRGGVNFRCRAAMRVDNCSALKRSMRERVRVQRVLRLSYTWNNTYDGKMKKIIFECVSYLSQISKFSKDA